MDYQRDTGKVPYPSRLGNLIVDSKALGAICCGGSNLRPRGHIADAADLAELG
jgi:hypothetical protein